MRIVLCGEATRTVSLTRGYSAIVDTEDYEDIIRYNWYADVGRWNVYAKTDQARRRPRMHVFIMEPSSGLIVHHIDGNGLNNAKSNLKIMTQAEHTRLSKLRYNKAGSKFRGVHAHSVNGYTAEIWLNYKKHYLGHFGSERLAALAYNNAALELLGEGNFIPNDVSGVPSEILDL